MKHRTWIALLARILKYVITGIYFFLQHCQAFLIFESWPFQCSLKGSIKGGEENHDCGSSSTSDQDQMDGIDRQGEMIIDTGECRKRLLFWDSVGRKSDKSDLVGVLQVPGSFRALTRHLTRCLWRVSCERRRRLLPFPSRPVHWPSSPLQLTRSPLMQPSLSPL